MSLLFVFDSLKTKHKVESEMLENNLMEFHSILDYNHLQTWLDLYSPKVVIIVLDDNSLFLLTQLVSQKEKDVDFYVVNDYLNSDSISNVDILAYKELLPLIKIEYSTWKSKTEVKKEDILIKIGEKYKRIGFADIIYIEAEGKYINLILRDRKFNIRTSLKSILNVLPTYFIRTHASYIVNIKKIDSIHINEQNIESGDFNIPFSRTYKKEILKNFHLG